MNHYCSRKDYSFLHTLSLLGNAVLLQLCIPGATLILSTTYLTFPVLTLLSTALFLHQAEPDSCSTVLRCSSLINICLFYLIQFFIWVVFISDDVTIVRNFTITDLITTCTRNSIALCDKNFCILLHDTGASWLILEYVGSELRPFFFSQGVFTVLCFLLHSLCTYALFHVR